ncbi:transposable element Tcb1 transposase [Trichonephila clavipes]|nr:transposable element Tcb1 transposase [Trichonephila clavipes]
MTGRGRLTSFSVEYKTGNQSLLECAESLIKQELIDMPLRRFRRQYEQLSQLERGRIIGMMEAGWLARRVAREKGVSDCAGTSGSKRCHLHEDQAQDALDRPAVEKISTS